MPRKVKSVKKRPAPYRALRTRSSTANSKSASVIEAASGQTPEPIAAAASAVVTLPDASVTNDISPGPVAPAAFPIFRLPRELRDLIYEYTDILPQSRFLEARLLTGEKIFSSGVVRANSNGVPFSRAWNRPSLLRVCRQMRHEVLDLFFIQNMVYFDDGSASESHKDFEESAWFRLAKLGKRASGPEIQPPRQIQSLWKDALANLRRMHVRIRPDAVTKPEWFSSAIKHAPRLSIVSLGIIDRRQWDPEPLLDAYCAALNEIESLRELKLAYGFQKEDVEVISKKVSCSVKILCNCRLEEKGDPLDAWGSGIQCQNVLDKGAKYIFFFL
ncbi:hypothetical protein GCG54_00013839 [Colletotrichum gloeosporioides]|uniref:2EXR domain-containing protein n=1 Tax=Colletotrichum gloeosporioides TaxID=474922 RepID=A0A8H4CVK6_COLGL|nr:uncharacterized protein GCG54_00013839 [Colletotrichum gloeosporioides]KAF3810597.1 hypothetical protein GCG54_00013839 [Colletotrichum gloeosporioides]